MKNKFITSVMSLAFLLVFSTSFTPLEAKHKKHTSIEMKILHANTRPTREVRVVERPIVVPRPVVVERPVIVEQPVVVERPVVVQRPIVVERPVYAYREPVYVQPAYYQEPVIYREVYQPRPSFFNSFSFGFSFFN